MHKLLRRIVPFLTSVSVFLTSVFAPVKLPSPADPIDVSVLTYPAEAVMTLEEAGVTEAQLFARDSADLPEYVQSAGYSDVNGVFISPYYTAKIGETAVPVYAACVHMWKDRQAGMHSFSEVYVDANKPFCWTLELKGGTVQLRNAVVLPQSLGMRAVCRNNTVYCSITKAGIYTFLFNGAKQRFGYTLFVRERTNDDAQIRRYIAQYGAENVVVFDRGVHELDYLHTQDTDGKVLYLREGAYLIAKHRYTIRSAEDEARYVEPEAVAGNSIRLTRFPFLNFYRSKNLTVAGHGVIDLTRLDRRERRGVVFTHCDNVQVRDVKIVNAPEWSFITYCCRGVTVENVDIFGCRGNSDAFALCNTQDALVRDCFARSADDLFEVKTLGGDTDSERITYQNCVAWGGYARCFGVTGEVCRAIRDVTFRDCAVIWRDATWDNDRIGSLVVIAEQTFGSVDGVTFENIEVFRDEGRAINVKVYDETAENFVMRNITFRNIRCVSYMPVQVAGNGRDGNDVQAAFENVRVNSLNPARKWCRGFLMKADRTCAVFFDGHGKPADAAVLPDCLMQTVS